VEEENLANELEEMKVIDNNNGDIQTPKGVKIIKDIPYLETNHKKHMLNIHKPDVESNSLLPVVVHIHGGGWQRGDRDSYFYGGPFIGSAFSKRGYVCVVVGYRVGSVYPECIVDVANAVKWTIDNIKQYGGDVDKLFISGHSAGAHLASLLVSSKKYLREVGVPYDIIKGVMAISGIYTVGNPFSECNYSLQTLVYRKLYVTPTFGNDDKIWLKASPIHHIGKRDNSGTHHRIPPFCIFNATMDLNLNFDGQKFHKLLTDKGISSQYHTLFGTHGTITRTDPVADLCSKFILDTLTIKDPIVLNT